jgi:hypothetical protein
MSIIACLGSGWSGFVATGNFHAIGGDFPAWKCVEVEFEPLDEQTPGFAGPTRSRKLSMEVAESVGHLLS